MKWALNGNNAQRQSRQCARPPLGWGRTHRGDVVASPGRREAVHAHDDLAVPVPAAADLLHDQRARRGLRVCRASRRVGAWPSATLRTHTNAPYKVLPDPLMGAVEGVYAIRWAQRPGVTASSRSMMRQSAARVRAFMPGARPSEFSMEGIFYI